MKSEMIRFTLLVLGGCLVTNLSACSTTSSGFPTRIARGVDKSAADTLLGPPDLVTMVPFQLDDSSNMQILLPATMGGRHGIFQLDTGDPWGQLLRQYVKSDGTGNLDTVRAGDSLPDQGGIYDADVTLGTLHVRASAMIMLDSGYAQNHRFQSNLGRVGLNALASVETIIDYRRHRLVLIRLDSAGHRLTAVPAYTPVTTIPLLKLDQGELYGSANVHWALVAHIGDVVDTLVIDTGTPVGVVFFAHGASKVQSHVVNGQLDHFTVGTRTFDHVGAELWSLNRDIGGYNLDLVGSPFLSRYGVVGLNQRTKRLILYE